jgi:hypothetical protein
MCNESRPKSKRQEEATCLLPVGLRHRRRKSQAETNSILSAVMCLPRSSQTSLSQLSSAHGRCVFHGVNLRCG